MYFCKRKRSQLSFILVVKATNHFYPMVLYAFYDRVNGCGTNIFHLDLISGTYLLHTNYFSAFTYLTLDIVEFLSFLRPRSNQKPTVEWWIGEPSKNSTRSTTLLKINNYIHYHDVLLPGFMHNLLSDFSASIHM